MRHLIFLGICLLLCGALHAQKKAIRYTLWIGDTVTYYVVQPKDLTTTDTITYIPRYLCCHLYCMPGQYNGLMLIAGYQKPLMQQRHSLYAGLAYYSARYDMIGSVEYRTRTFQDHNISLRWQKNIAYIIPVMQNMLRLPLLRPGLRVGGFTQEARWKPYVQPELNLLLPGGRIQFGFSRFQPTSSLKNGHWAFDAGYLIPLK
jgi:hypothetical protein